MAKKPTRFTHVFWREKGDDIKEVPDGFLNNPGWRRITDKKEIRKVLAPHERYKADEISGKNPKLAFFIHEDDPYYKVDNDYSKLKKELMKKYPSCYPALVEYSEKTDKSIKEISFTEVKNIVEKETKHVVKIEKGKLMIIDPNKKSGNK